jgi:hypothetical protein
VRHNAVCCKREFIVAEALLVFDHLDGNSVRVGSSYGGDIAGWQCGQVLHCLGQVGKERQGVFARLLDSALHRCGHHPSRAIQRGPYA